MAETIPINRISMDGTQTRVELKEDIIDEYAEAYEAGIKLPEIDVYFDGEIYWLADGFHRVAAARKAGRDTINADVHQGDKRAALLHSLGANETHGLRRNYADRRNAIQILLADPEWSQWNNSEIARKCHVSEKLVRRVIDEIRPQREERVKEGTRKVRRGGKTYDMRTERIGASRKKSSAKFQVAAVEQSATPAISETDELPAEIVSSAQPKIELGVPATAAPAQEPPPETPPAPSPTPALTVEREIGSAESITAVAQEPPSLSDIPPESLPTAEFKPGPIETAPDTVAAGRITFELHATTISEELLQQVTLRVRWEYATTGERQEFVAEHRAELQKMLGRLDRKAAAS